MRMTRISSALFIVTIALVAACGTQSAGAPPATPDPMDNDTATDTLSLK